MLNSSVHEYFTNAVDSSSLLHNVDYTICLNAVGTGDQLYVHTSKPPKPGSAPFGILQVSCRVCWMLVHLPLETFFLWNNDETGIE